MKKFFLLVFLALQLQQIFALDKPKSVTLNVSQTTVKAGDLVELVLTIVPMDHFHVYAEKSTCPPDIGQPVAQISFSGDNIELVGKPYGVGYEMRKDDLAEFDKVDCKVGVFPGNGVFKQKIKILGLPKNIHCNFLGQMCSDERCVRIVLPTIDFNATFSFVGAEKPIEPSKPTADTGITIPKDTAKSAVKTETKPSYKSKGPGDIGKCTPLSSKRSEGSKGLWWVFLAALTSGFIALLTPCVFPMIPMTVSFFIKNTDRKKGIRDGLIFAFSIIFIYVIFGTIFAVVFGANAANWLSTHWIPNVFFFLIFIVFAASFFGAFEIVLPSSWVNAMDKRADRGGWTGPVFMAFTIALVSFSCTGPIVGNVVVEAVKGGFIQPIVAMFGFSLAFALPFGLLVIFPSYLSSLPKSGGWLNSVKVVLGFIELAFALKFLSTADQTYHWHILDREVYLSLWIVIVTLLGVYLLGKLKFAHDSELNYLSFGRFSMAIIAFSFAIYMLPGLWGAPLKFLAGYLPPMATQDFELNRIVLEATGKSTAACREARYSDQLHLPHGIQGYFDYEQALDCAREQKKPVFVDFTGHGCVNCRRMEEKVWSDPAVLKKLKSEFVVVSLYVDDKKIKLPADEVFIAKSSGAKVTMLGEKNAEIQACFFNSNSQPMYVLMTADEELLQDPGSAETFEYNPGKFLEFLNNGLKEFKAIKK
jgi:thiol:disulfide interchange protein DsbD